MSLDLAEVDAFAERAHARGIWFLPVGADRCRLVTHLDVDDAGIDAALATFTALR